MKHGRNDWIRRRLAQLGPVVRRMDVAWAVIGLFVLSALLSHDFLKGQNLVNILKQVAVVGIGAIGSTFVIITAGIDLSVGAVMGLTAVMIAALQKLPMFLAIGSALAAASAFGLFNGFLAAHLRIPPFIATLGMMGVGSGLSLAISGSRPIFIFAGGYEFVGGGTLLGVPMPIVIYLVVGLAFGLLLGRTRFGLYMYAMGGNEDAAYLSGVNVRLYKTLVYMLGGFLAGMSGMVLAGRTTTGDPTIGTPLTLDVVAAAILGGTRLEGGVGSVPRTVMGTLIIGILNNICNLLSVSPYYQMILKGGIIVAAVWATSARLRWRHTRRPVRAGARG